MRMIMKFVFSLWVFQSKLFIKIQGFHCDFLIVIIVILLYTTLFQTDFEKVTMCETIQM